MKTQEKTYEEINSYKNLIHYRPLPSVTLNVRCLNGSAHVLTSEDIESVTCPLCKDPLYAFSDFWADKFRLQS